MTDSEILNAKNFTFTPFAADAGGDSGALTLATLKSDSHIQYVVKSGYSEIACNEFMYHHVAAALGLYTQDARLFKGIPNSKYAVGIRYVPNARKFILDEADEKNKKIFYEFWTLFRILNEDDSEEYFYDEQNRVFKLDNASSFNLNTHTVDSILKYKSKEPPEWIWQMLRNAAHHLEYEKYGIVIHILGKNHGQAAAESGFEMFRRFSEFDLSKIEPATETLEKIYPLTITEYYSAFIELRIEACKKFVAENTVSQLTGG